MNIMIAIHTQKGQGGYLPNTYPRARRIHLDTETFMVRYRMVGYARSIRGLIESGSFW